MAVENGKDWYRNLLDNPAWQRKVAEVHLRDNSICMCCKDTKTHFEVHHIEYVGKPFDAPLDKLVLLCRHCHRTIEKFNLPWGNGLTAKKIVSPNMAVVIVCHTKGLVIGSFEDNETVRIVNMDDGLFSQLMHMKINQWQEDDEQQYLKDRNIKTDS